ncbi:hypothetical protein [Pedobacter sp.]|uniref:hypothetical protein n=1 Tax=Pedobacter sp. TaxID=1411316 RepID=UPI002B68ACF5|nr:hypothetical protein [Pedobacter sp.]HWW42953.1 hypothetical protein [Pedobacter sp.]
MNENSFDLAALREIIDEVRDKNRRGYLDLQTVENFIFHFDELPTNEIKREVYISLLDYLQVIKGMDASEINRNTSTEMYNKILAPIGIKYVLSSNFTVNFRISVLVYLFLIAVLIMFFLGIPLKIYIIVAVLFLAQHFRCVLKRRQKRVYGNFY